MHPPDHSYRLLYTMPGVTSQALMDDETLVCPLCGAPATPIALRTGLSSFVAALGCLRCDAIFRAVDSFSLRD
jgi:hypothetical protein